MKESNRSTEIMTISFGGENEINAKLLRDSIDDIIHLLESSRDAFYPDEGMEIKISSLRAGSFVLDISVIADIASIVRDNVPFASTIISGFLGFLQIRKLLAGKEPAKISQNGDGNVVIIGDNNTTLIVTEALLDQYMKPEVNTIVSEIFTNLKKDGSRTNLCIKTHNVEEVIYTKEFTKMSSSEQLVNEELLRIKRQSTETVSKKLNLDNRDSFDKINANIVRLADNEKYNTMKEFKIDTIDDYIQDQSIISTELVVRIPDLSGESRWGFKYHGKNIFAIIEDEAFINRVRSGDIQFRAKDILPVIMSITWMINEKGEKIGNVKYIINKITGEVIHVQ